MSKQSEINPYGVDPKIQCIKCAGHYRLWDEYCSHCGFDPTDNDDDAALNEAATKEWESKDG